MKLVLLKLLLVVTCGGSIYGCRYFNSVILNTEVIEPPGKNLLYSCIFPNVDKAYKNVYFTWLPNPPSETSIKILISDDTFYKHSAAIIAIVDTKNKRIDQFRNRNGDALEFSLTDRYVTLDVALSQGYVKYSKLILEEIPRFFDKKTPINSSSSSQAIAYASSGVQYLIPSKPTVTMQSGYGLLPSKLQADGTTLCEYKGEGIPFK